MSSSKVYQLCCHKTHFLMETCSHFHLAKLYKFFKLHDGHCYCHIYFYIGEKFAEKTVIWITDILKCLVIGCNVTLVTWKKPSSSIFVHKFPLSYFSWQ